MKPINPAARAAARPEEWFMICTRNGRDALASRFTLISPGTGIEHRGCEVLGLRVSRGHAPGPWQVD